MSDSIAKQLSEQLRQRSGQGPGSIGIAAGGVSVGVEVESSERYASSVRGMQARPQQPVADVGAVAEQIVERVTDLDGPLSIVELDARAGRAIVRSAEPETTPEGVGYWEADVRDDGVSLQHYHKQHSQPDRDVVAEPLMNSTIGRIAEQLTDALR